MRKFIFICILACTCTGVYAQKSYENLDPVVLAKAKQGDAEAQYAMGLHYNNYMQTPAEYIENGADTTYKIEADRWFRLAADQGHAEAQAKLGFLKILGLGEYSNPKEGVKWIRKSAEQGCAMGQLFLGTCYRRGAGVKKSTSKAKKWLRKAAAQGNEDAKKALENIRR